MAKIKMTDITEDRWRDIDDHLLKWRWTGGSCEPVDKEATEELLTDFYRRIGKDKPHFVYLSSPLACELYINILKAVTKDNPTQLRTQLDSQLDSQLYTQLRNQLDSQLYTQLSNQLDSQLDTQLYTQLSNQLHSQLDSQLERPGSDYWASTYSYWVAWLLGGEIIGAKYDEDNRSLLGAWEKLCSSCFWFYPYDGFCVVSDRPEEIHWNDEWELHEINFTSNGVTQHLSQ